MTVNPDVAQHERSKHLPFRPELLPSVDAFYSGQLRKRSRASASGWVQALCPFHPDKNPSFSFNRTSGAYRCFGCDAHGGDIVSFVMLRDGLDFKRAAMSLGAWVPTAHSSRGVHLQFARAKRQREQRDAEVEWLIAAERDLRLRYRSEIHTLEARQRSAAARLADPAITVDAAEQSMQELAALLPHVRAALAAYFFLSFAAVAERIEFLRHPDSRAATIETVLGRGFVRDDDGRTLEVVGP